MENIRQTILGPYRDAKLGPEIDYIKREILKPIWVLCTTWRDGALTLRATELQLGICTISGLQISCFQELNKKLHGSWELVVMLAQMQGEDGLHRECEEMWVYVLQDKMRVCCKM